jgi:multiple sugar transport system substrate-binding protein
MAAGTGPDIFQVPTYTWPRFIETKSILELDPMGFGAMTLPELEAQFVPKLLGIFKVKDKLYAGPAQASVYMHAFTPLLFPDGYPQTWDDLTAASKRITKIENGAAVVETLNLAADNPETVESRLGPFIWEKGADFLSADGTKSALTSEATLAGIATMRKLVDDKVWIPGFPASSQMLATGKEGASPDGDWSLGEYDRLADEAKAPKVGLAPVPVYKAGEQSKMFVTAWAYLVNAATKHPKEAWQAVGFFLNTANSKRWTAECGMYNGRLADWVVELERQDPRLKVAHDNLSNGVLGPMTSKFDEIMEPIVEATQKVMLENAPLQETMAAASTKVDQVLAS